MSWMLWGSLLLVCLMGAMSPGPSLAVVLRETVRNSRWHGVVAGLSHALGVGLWAFLTVHGLALLVTGQQLVFTALSWAGAAYLAWMGVQAWRHAGEAGALDVGEARVHSLLGAARAGAVISLLNPKLALFFMALFSQFVSADQSSLTQWVMILTATLVDGAWYSLVALMLSHPRLLKALRRRATWVERATGALLVGLAVRVVTL
ncbi:amino acid efflux permease RhtB family protein [Marinobacterium zhoushanense]|uniref:Amino acid efflux permease RhtB family protein n=1 Tax=Marinobacterium zhoushanense TaxID=1679163 RepID=A0ABQ1JX84_9GAMM|nr:LysE family translocator [Marinobacterium zhoushanense]GGB80128.1 amino acid efflux permease RhtB family protein [Marinobacterium zhoushanense]